MRGEEAPARQGVRYRIVQVRPPLLVAATRPVLARRPEPDGAASPTTHPVVGDTKAAPVASCMAGRNRVGDTRAPPAVARAMAADWGSRAGVKATMAAVRASMALVTPG